MENNKSVTAVEWLLENLNSEPYSEEEFNYNRDCWDKAKEMEKEQIIEAYGHGQNNGYMYAFHKAITINREQYYTETYESE